MCIGFKQTQILSSKLWYAKGGYVFIVASDDLTTQTLITTRQVIRDLLLEAVARKEFVVVLPGVTDQILPGVNVSAIPHVNTQPIGKLATPYFPNDRFYYVFAFSKPNKE